MPAYARIYLDPAALEDIPELTREIPGNGDTAYVRADIADQMAEALHDAREFVDHYSDGTDNEDGGADFGGVCANTVLQEMDAALAAYQEAKK